MIFGPAAGSGQGVAREFARAGSALALCYRSKADVAERVADEARALGSPPAPIRSTCAIPQLSGGGGRGDWHEHGRIHSMVWGAGPLVGADPAGQMERDAAFRNAMEIEAGFHHRQPGADPAYARRGGAASSISGPQGTMVAQARWPFGGAQGRQRGAGQGHRQGRGASTRSRKFGAGRGDRRRGCSTNCRRRGIRRGLGGRNPQALVPAPLGGRRKTSGGRRCSSPRRGPITSPGRRCRCRAASVSDTLAPHPCCPTRHWTGSRCKAGLDPLPAVDRGDLALVRSLYHDDAIGRPWGDVLRHGG